MNFCLFSTVCQRYASKVPYDGLQKIKFEKSRAKYKAEHADELKMFYTARRKLTEEFPDGKVDMKKLSDEYDELEQAHNTTYGEFKTCLLYTSRCV